VVLQLAEIMERFITGNKFKDLANYTFAPQSKRGDDYYKLPNTYDPGIIKDGDIIYTDIGYVQELFKIPTDKQIILITHNGDSSANIIPPGNIIRWFTVNVNITYPRIESIPIGMENDLWFPEVHKKEKIINQLSKPRTYRNLVYMSHSIATNPAIRKRIYDIYEGESWITSARGSNRPNLFDEYLDNIYNHKFVISPQGNGLDTHRTWECLYVDTIPIEKRNPNNRFYIDLPICFVDEWEDLTEGYLELEFMRIKASKWNLEKLNFEYWKNKICG
jgi:hypothetical protein